MSDGRELFWSAVFLAAVLIVIGTFWVYGASVEAETFTRLTGNEITAWEAMWVNARIDCN